MNALSQEMLTHIVRLCPDGVVVCEHSGEDWPLVFANEAFERLTGYAAGELIGRDLRILQLEDREQETRGRIREALSKGMSVKVLMRNYRKDGTQFWNEMMLTPVNDVSGRITHCVGFHRDAGERLRFEPRAAATVAATPGAQRDGFTTTGTYPSLLSVLRDDRLTGLFNRGYFDEVFRRDWNLAQREKRLLGLLVFDIDSLGVYNDTFGRPAGDACIKRVGRAIAGCLKRGSDVIARLEGGMVVALIHGADKEQALQFANLILEKVREQLIHHPRSSVQRYVTVSCGMVTFTADSPETPESMLDKARLALKAAKDSGRNQVSVAD